MSDDQLRARIVALQDKVASLEKQLAEEPPPGRSGLLLGLVCLAVLASLFLVHQGGDAFQRPPRDGERPDNPTDKKPGPGPALVGTEASYQSVKIIDAQGKPCMLLGSNERGGVLQILGKDGLARVVLNMDEDGGNLSINGNDGKARTVFWVTQGGKHGMLTIFNDQSKPVSILTGNDDGGYLKVNNAQGKARAVFAIETGKDSGLLNLIGKTDRRLVFVGRTSDDVGGLMQVFGQDGNPRASLSTNNDGGALDIYANDPKNGGAFLGVAKNRKSGLLLLYGQDGGKTVHLGEVDTAAGPNGALYLYGVNGQPRLNLEGDKDGGILCVRNSQGQPGAYLWIDNDGRGGLLQLHAFADGKARIVGGINRNGIGFLESRDNVGATAGSLR